MSQEIYRKSFQSKYDYGTVIFGWGKKTKWVVLNKYSQLSPIHVNVYMYVRINSDLHGVPHKRSDTSTISLVIIRVRTHD
jgi:hypothetical protein